jgi:hypothetical protein
LISRQLEIISREINVLILFEFDLQRIGGTKSHPIRHQMQMKRDFDDIYTEDIDPLLQSSIRRYCAPITKIALNCHQIKPSNQFVCIFDLKSRMRGTQWNTLHPSLQSRKNGANDKMRRMQTLQLPLGRHGNQRQEVTIAPTNEGPIPLSPSCATGFTIAKRSVRHCKSIACLDNLQACAIECRVQ